MTRTNTRKPAAAVVALAGGTLLVAVLTGCSHGSDGPDGKDKTAAASRAKPAVGSQPAPKADAIANDPKARPSVSMRDCAATGSGWSAGGTVTNSKDKDATFTIVVSFTTRQSTVLARGETTVKVKAGATRSWAANASFAKSKGTQCVLRGVAES